MKTTTFLDTQSYLFLYKCNIVYTPVCEVRFTVTSRLKRYFSERVNGCHCELLIEMNRRDLEYFSCVVGFVITFVFFFIHSWNSELLKSN